MVTYRDAFTGFSVDDLARAHAFYASVLGMTVEGDPDGGSLRLVLPSGQGVFVYPKGAAHVPAEYTVLNLVVADLDRAVDELQAAGVETKIYGDESGTDARGIFHGSQRDMGPDICWFRDPAGNVLSVVQE